MSTLDQRTASHAKTIKTTLSDHIEAKYKSGTWFGNGMDDKLNQSIGTLSEAVMNVLYQAVAEKDRQSPAHATCRVEDGKVHLDVARVADELAQLSTHVPAMNQVTVNLINAHYNAHCRGEHGADYSNEDVADGIGRLLANDDLHAEPSQLAAFIGEMRTHEATGGYLSAGWTICNQAISDSLDPEALAASLPPRAPDEPKRDATNDAPSPQRPKP